MDMGRSSSRASEAGRGGSGSSKAKHSATFYYLIINDQKNRKENGIYFFKISFSGHKFINFPKGPITHISWSPVTRHLALLSESDLHLLNTEDGSLHPKSRYPNSLFYVFDWFL